MSRTSESYAAYVERERATYATFFEPQTFQYNEVGALSDAARREGTLISGVCKYWGGFGSVYEMPDGRMIEIAPTSSGMSYVAAVFPSRSLRDAWRTPMTFNQYFDRW